MLVHGFVPVSRANGPGRRAVLWFQGCNLNCPECWNQTSHPFEGAPTGEPGTKAGFAETTEVVEFLSTVEGLQLNRAFASIKDPKVRKKVVDLVVAIASSPRFEEHDRAIAP